MPGEKPKNLRATLSRILTYIGKNRRLIIAMLAVMLVATLLNVIAPTIQANAIDSIAKLDANCACDLACRAWRGVSLFGGVHIFPEPFCGYAVTVYRKSNA